MSLRIVSLEEALARLDIQLAETLLRREEQIEQDLLLRFSEEN